MEHKNEVWKPYNNIYEVSNYGRIKSVERTVNSHNGGRKVKSRILKLTKTKYGYYRVAVYENGIAKMTLVHRLVALMFLKNKENKRTINHIDGNKTNNHISNLEWNTDKENTQHAFKIGLCKKRKGIKNHRAKKVINTKTNDIYHSVGEVHKYSKSKYSYSYFSGMLNGSFKNKTSFKILKTKNYENRNT